MAKTVNGQTMLYWYNDQGLIAESEATGQMTKAYGWTPHQSHSTSPLWQADINGTGSQANLGDNNTAYHFLHNDHLGTPKLVINPSGQPTWKGYSQAFGKTAVDSASSTTVNLRFPGQYFDQETGLHYNYQRDYIPEVGRYVQRDPVGLEGAGIRLRMRGNVAPCRSTTQPGFAPAVE